MQIVFGSGLMYATRTDVADATPLNFGQLQDVSVDFNSTMKELIGSYQMPIGVARGAMKISGKCKTANISGRVLGDLFFGSGVTSGEERVASELGTIATGAITVENDANFVEDKGVVLASTGVPFKKVDTAPKVGEYSVDVATGVYKFDVSENGKEVRIAYVYSATTGQTIELNNQLLGSQPVFSIVLSGNYNGKHYSLTLNRCVATKAGFQFKNEDFTTPDFEFGAFADDSNSIGKFTVTDLT